MWIEESDWGNFLLEDQVLETKGVVLGDRNAPNTPLPPLWRLWLAQWIKQKPASLGSSARKYDKIFCVAMKTFLCFCWVGFFSFLFSPSQLFWDYLDSCWHPWLLGIWDTFLLLMYPNIQYLLLHFKRLERSQCWGVCSCIYFLFFLSYTVSDIAYLCAK